MILQRSIKSIECFQEFHVNIFKERLMRKAYTIK